MLNAMHCCEMARCATTHTMLASLCCSNEIQRCTSVIGYNSHLVVCRKDAIGCHPERKRYQESLGRLPTKNGCADCPVAHPHLASRASFTEAQRRSATKRTP